MKLCALCTHRQCDTRVDGAERGAATRGLRYGGGVFLQARHIADLRAKMCEENVRACWRRSACRDVDVMLQSFNAVCHIRTPCESMMYGLPPHPSLSPSPSLHTFACVPPLTYFPRSIRTAQKKKMSQCSQRSVILWLHPSFSTPVLFVSVLLSSSLLFSSPPALSLLFPRHSAPTGQILSFLLSYLSTPPPPPHLSSLFVVFFLSPRCRCVLVHLLTRLLIQY